MAAIWRAPSRPGSAREDGIAARSIASESRRGGLVGRSGATPPAGTARPPGWGVTCPSPGSCRTGHLDCVAKVSILVVGCRAHSPRGRHDGGRHVAQPADESRKRLTNRIAQIRRERRTWAEKAAIGVVPDDIARDKQHGLALNLGRAEAELAALHVIAEDLEAKLAETIRKARDCSWAYREADEKLRREWNQTWWKWLSVDVTEDGPQVVGGNRTDLYDALQQDAEVVAATFPALRGLENDVEKTTAVSVGDGLNLAGLVHQTGQSSNIRSIRPHGLSLRTLVGRNRTRTCDLSRVKAVVTASD